MELRLGVVATLAVAAAGLPPTVPGGVVVEPPRREQSAVTATECTVDAGRTTPTPFQFGTMIWSWWSENPTRAPALLKQLPASFRWIRWSPVMYSDTAPAGKACSTAGAQTGLVPDADMDAFVKSKVLDDAGLAQLKQTAQGMDALGITQLAFFWQPPTTYRYYYDGIQYFNLWCSYDYGAFVASCMRRLRDNGVNVSYLELQNEPDGYWYTVTHNEPNGWNIMLNYTRAALDRRQLHDVVLTGPSLSTLKYYPLINHTSNTTYFKDNQVARYLDGLTEVGKSALGAMSFHSYDRIYRQSETVQWLDGLWRDVSENVLDVFDPQRTRKRIMSEFSVEVQQLETADGTVHFQHNAMNATCYPGVHAAAPYSDAEQYHPVYAVQTFAYALLHINGGLDAAVLWELADRGDTTGDNKCFGLFDRANSEKPVAEVLFRNLLAFVPDARSLRPVQRTWSDPLSALNVTAAAFLPDSATDTLVAGFANTGGQARTVQLRFLGAFQRVAGALVYNGSTHAQKIVDGAVVPDAGGVVVAAALDGGAVAATVNLPAFSAVTLLLEGGDSTPAPAMTPLPATPSPTSAASHAAALGAAAAVPLLLFL